jgi:hypothetical protein
MPSILQSSGGRAVLVGEHLVIGGNSSQVNISYASGSISLTPSVAVWGNAIILPTASEVSFAAPPTLTTISITTSNLVTLTSTAPAVNLANVSIGAGPSGTPPITSVQLVGAALTQASVDAIIAACLVGGASNGILDISGGSSAAPSVTGAFDVATLLGFAWTVTTN